MRAILSRPVEEIIPDLRREGSVRLVSAGRTFLSVPLEVVTAERIEVGLVVGPDQLARLERAADRDAAYRTAIRLLERRPFARKDLARRLSMKGHPPESVQTALERAEAAGYIDDVRFATHYVQSRTARGRGPTRLRRELLAMGVARELVDDALGGEVTGPEAVRGRVEEMIAKRLPQLRGRAAPDARRRLLAFLARRGYTGGEITELVRAAVRQDGR